jgi:glycosyltransferase involved in cell wall biosynthesis
MMEPLRILFLSPYVPSRVRIRPYNLIRHLTERGHEVTVIAACTSQRESADAAAFRHHCKRLEVVRVPLTRSWWNCLRGLGTGLPLQALYAYSPTLTRRLAAEVGTAGARNGATGRYDLLHIEHLRAVLNGMTANGLPRVYDSVDCISLLCEKTLRTGTTPGSRIKAFVDLKRTRRLEGRLVHRFDRILTAAATDLAALAALGKECGGADRLACAAPISIVPNGVDLEYFARGTTVRAPTTLVFVGRMSYHANVAAAQYMVRSILPRIWAQHPEVRLEIVGQDPPREVQALARRSEGRVTVTGTVPDVRPYLARASVSVSPLRYAVGLPNKILEAMSLGTPVVTTPIGVASLGARDDEHLLVAGDSAHFAMQVSRLLMDPPLRQRLSEAGRRYVERHHNWAPIIDQLEEIYLGAIAQFRARAKVHQ